MQSSIKKRTQITTNELPPKLTPEEQAEANYVRRKYREQYACQYIPEINKNREKINPEIASYKVQQYIDNVFALTSQFARITFEVPFCLENHKTNTYSEHNLIIPYPLLQKKFKYMVVVDKYNFNRMSFVKGTFFGDFSVSYYGLIPKEESTLIPALLGKGYSILGEQENFIKLGNKFNVIMPFNNSDEIFFFGKHFFYYHVYTFLRSSERSPSLFSVLLDQLIILLRNMLEGFYYIKENIQNFSIRPYVNCERNTQEVYDKFLFAHVREFNKINRRFFYSLQISNAPDKLT